MRGLFRFCELNLGTETSKNTYSSCEAELTESPNNIPTQTPSSLSPQNIVSVISHNHAGTSQLPDSYNYETQEK